MNLRHLCFLTIIGGIGLCVSCATIARDLADALDISAQGTAREGYISQTTADNISQTGYAVSKLLEDITPEQEYYIGRAVGASLLTHYSIYAE